MKTTIKRMGFAFGLAAFLLSPQIGRCFYDPSTGKWLNRDPIQEESGINLYEFVSNEPFSRIDAFGLAELQPKPLPENEVACCTESKIAEGEKKLNAAFQKSVAMAQAQGIKPVGPGKPGATCKNSSLDIIEWLAPFPPCWKCHLEERDYFSPKDDPNDDRLDHQVIICVAYLSGAKKNKEIMFDWWGDIYHTFRSNRSGGSPDTTRKEFRYLRRIIQLPYTTDCNGMVKVKPPPCAFGNCTAK